MTSVIHKFELTDSRVFNLPIDNNISVTHLATIQWKMREFIYFRTNHDGQTYIEEVVLKPTVQNNRIVAKYQFIDDNNLWRDLAEFLTENGITEMQFSY